MFKFNENIQRLFDTPTIRDFDPPALRYARQLVIDLSLALPLDCCVTVSGFFLSVLSFFSICFVAH
jgi:hypothetical protein